jgi:hypothetical protein
MTHFLVITGILLREAVIVKPEHIVLPKKKTMLTKNLAIFIKFWRFHSSFDKAITVTSRSKTVIAVWQCLALHFNALLPDSQLHDCQVASYALENSRREIK